MAQPAAKTEHYGRMITDRPEEMALQHEQIRLSEVVEERLNTAKDLAKPRLMAAVDTYNNWYRNKPQQLQKELSTPAKQADIKERLEQVTAEFLPSHIGGYYHTKTGKTVVNAKNLLDESRLDWVVRSIVHEMYHNLGIEDEAFTDLVAKEGQSLAQDDGIDSGYSQEVNALKKKMLRAGIKPVHLYAELNPQDKLKTAAGFLFQLYIYPKLRSGDNQALFTESGLFTFVRANLDSFKELFPRALKSAGSDMQKLFSAIKQRMVEDIMYDYQRYDTTPIKSILTDTMPVYSRDNPFPPYIMQILASASQSDDSVSLKKVVEAIFNQERPVIES